MSIRSFVESAIILYENKKYSEALCLACIAVDASSAKKYPNESTSKRYKHFLEDNFEIICVKGNLDILAGEIMIKVNRNIPNLTLDKNGYVKYEQIIYHVLRCGLVHSCNIENLIEFTDTTIICDWNIDSKFPIPKNLIFGLLSIAITD